MRISRIKAWTLSLSVIIVGPVLITNCSQLEKSGSLNSTAVLCSPFNFSNQLPSTNTSLGSQAAADCFAWSEFVALNWPSDSSISFGMPGDTSLVQWQTFMPSNLVFQPGAATPPPWGTTAIAGSGNFAEKIRSGKYLVLTMQSKIPQDFQPNEAVSGPAWLGAQNGTNIWYEIRMNQDEYNYIVNNQFYNAKIQQASVQHGTPIVLPDTPTGALEIKAAWMEVPDITRINSNRFKLSVALVQDTEGGPFRQTMVALIGMHILRKTFNQQNFVWATFEQVDNISQPGAMAPYNLYNPACRSQTLIVKTLLNADTSVTIVCDSNGTVPQPPYYLVNGNPIMPIQVTRKLQFDVTAAATNRIAQANIQATYPNSVWQYYQLVNVMWSNNPTITQLDTIPLNTNSMNPPYMSNLAIESYVQLSSCAKTCHKFATAAAPPNAQNWNYASDFSFLFQNADTLPGTGPKKNKFTKIKYRR